MLYNNAVYEIIKTPLAFTLLRYMILYETEKRIIQPLVIEEKDLAKKILKMKLEAAAKKTLSVVLYGSVSEGKERPESDVDVFFLTKDPQTKEILKEKLSDLAEDFAISTGNRLDSLIWTVAEYRKEKNNKKGVIEAIEKGELLFGKPIGEVIQK